MENQKIQRDRATRFFLSGTMVRALILIALVIAALLFTKADASPQTDQRFEYNHQLLALTALHLEARQQAGLGLCYPHPVLQRWAALKALMLTGAWQSTERQHVFYDNREQQHWLGYVFYAGAIRALGYNGEDVSEMIVAYRPDVPTAFNDLMASSVHQAGLMKVGATDCGYGIGQAPDGAIHTVIITGQPRSI